MGKAKETNVTHAPIRQSVHIDCPPEDAFRLFTEGFAEWWPLRSPCFTRDDSEYCAIEPWVGGRIYEHTRSGEEHDWGTVTVWNPPDRIEFNWHPGEREDHDQTVTVDFQVEADGTRVTLTHQNWHGSGVGTCASHFARFVSEQLVLA
jgi:uncharacterized protein YndB with AHSA1/START domain